MMRKSNRRQQLGFVVYCMVVGLVISLGIITSLPSTEAFHHGTTNTFSKRSSLKITESSRWRRSSSSSSLFGPASCCLSMSSLQTQQEELKRITKKEEGNAGGGDGGSRSVDRNDSLVLTTSERVPYFANLKTNNSAIETKSSSSDSLNEEDSSYFESYDPLLISEIDKVDDRIEHDMDDLKDNQQPIGIWVARGLLLLVAVLWGTNFASVKYLETLCFHPPCNHPPSEAALARFGVAAIAGIPFLINQRSDVILAGLECGIYICLGYFTQALALSYISSGQCAFICSLTVVVVPILSFLLYGKPFKTSNITSGLLALAGVAVLEGLVDFDSLLGVTPAIASTTAASTAIEGIASSSPAAVVSDAAAVVSSTTTAAASTGMVGSAIGNFLTQYKGDLLALGQPIGFGLAFMRIEHYVEQFKDVKNRVLTISAAQCLAAGFISMLWVLYDYHGIIPNMGYMIEPHRIGAIAWTGIMTTVVAIYLEGVALQVASATEASLLFSSEPVWASLFGAWLLHETLGINSYVGGAIILSACILSALSDIGELNDDTSNEEDSTSTSAKAAE